MPYFWKVGGLKSRGPISIPGVQISQSLSPGSVAAPGRAFRACFLFVSPVGVRFALLPFLCFCFPGRRCRLFACPRMPFRFVLVAPGRTFRIAAFFLFLHPGVAFLSALLLSFWQSLSVRFAFFSFIQVSAFPFSLVGIPACAFRVAFFSAAPGRPVSPAPRRVRILFCLAPRRARLALWVFSHLQSCISSLPGPKKHLGKTPKHSNAKRTLRDDEK